MKKPVYLMFAALLALAVFGCEPEDDSSPSSTGERFDSRLFGGKWSTPRFYKDIVAGEWVYVEDIPYKSGYFKFFNENGKPQMYTKGSALSGWYHEYSGGFFEDQYYQCEVYSKDGVIYRASDNKKLLQYKFETKYPYTDLNIMAGQGYDILTRMNQVAENGDLITYSIYNETGAIYTDINISSEYWLLNRFSE
jgi:hypothetical protein